MSPIGMLIIVIMGCLIAIFIDAMISAALNANTEESKPEYITPQLILDRGLVAQMWHDELITEKQYRKIQNWLTEKEQFKQESE